MQTSVVLAFGAYFSVLLLIGLLSHKKSSNEADFVIGGRSLNYWVTALSAHASDMSSWLFMAFPMALFVGGPSQIWIAVGLLLGMFLSWQFMAPRLRRATEEYNCFTISSFLQKRFHDNSGVIRVVSAVMTLLFMVNYLSVGLTTMGVIFDGVFNIDYELGICVATAVIVLYTLIGGFVTVAWTDMFQACFLLLVLIVVPIMALSSMGGFTEVVEAAAEQGISLSLAPSGGSFGAIQAAFLILGWGLGYFGQLHIASKFMGIANPSELNKSKWLGMSWQLLALGSAALVGIVGIGFFREGLGNPELVFVEMVNRLFSPAIGAFVLCAMLAAVISTMDSQILVSAGVLSEDIYRVLFGERHSDSDMLQKSRWSVVVVSAVALLVARSQHAIMDTVVYSWTGLGCAFGPLILMALYDKKANKAGAITGIVVGGVVAATWHWINPLLCEMVIPAMIPGFSLAALSIYGVSRLGSKG